MTFVGCHYNKRSLSTLLFPEISFGCFLFFCGQFVSLLLPDTQIFTLITFFSIFLHNFCKKSECLRIFLKISLIYTNFFVFSNVAFSRHPIFFIYLHFLSQSLQKIKKLITQINIKNLLNLHKFFFIRYVFVCSNVGF